MITFACPHCGQNLQIGDELAGQQVSCSLCGGLCVAIVPAASSPSPEAGPAIAVPMATPASALSAPLGTTDDRWTSKDGSEGSSWFVSRRPDRDSLLLGVIGAVLIFVPLVYVYGGVIGTVGLMAGVQALRLSRSRRDVGLLNSLLGSVLNVLVLGLWVVILYLVWAELFV